jgi:hypothetical protein
MTGVMRVRVAAALVATCLALSPLLPALHVHEADDHGHPTRVAHQHLSAHALAPESGVGRHVESDDEPILTLTTRYTVPPPVHGVVAPVAEVVALLAAPDATLVRRQAQYVEPVIHGPPRAPTSPRPPPLTPAV